MSDVIAGAIVPEAPKVLPNEHFTLYAPLADADKAGVVKIGASSDGKNYIDVAGGTISLNLDNLSDKVDDLITPHKTELEEKISELTDSLNDGLTELNNSLNNGFSDIESRLPDGLYVNEEDGKLYLVVKGETLGGGIDFPDGGTGFDSLLFENGNLHVMLGGEDVVDPVFIGSGGGGGGYGSSIKIVNRMPSKNFSVSDSSDDVFIKYYVESKDTSDGSYTGDVTTRWYVDNVAVKTEKVGLGEREFNIRPYLKRGAVNEVKLYVEDDYGSNRTFVWRITVTYYSLSWNLSDLANHRNSALDIRLIVQGSGEKVVRLFLDDTKIYEEDYSVAQATIAMTIEAQTHGIHTLVATLEVNGEEISDARKRHVGVWTEDDNTETIVALYENTFTTNQFDTVQIPYLVCKSGLETVPVTLKRNGEVVSEFSVDSSRKEWSYKAQDTIPADEESVTVKLSIESGEVSKDVDLTVLSIGDNISPVTTGLVFDINPQGHSSAENPSRPQFGYVDASGTTHPFEFSANFDWNNGGFQTDSDGVTAFVVKRGCYVMADRSLFDNDPKSNGKHIKLMFKSTAVRNASTEIISCASKLASGSGNPIGISLKAESAEVSTNLQSIKVPYSANKLIEMDISIEPEDKVTRNGYCCMYLKAVPSQEMEYTNGDTWTQASGNNAKLKIGSNDADVWIYRIKMHNVALTKRDILTNFVADCTNSTEIVNRFARNDVFNADGTFNISNLSVKNPGLRVFHIKGNRMTTGKKDKVTVDVDMLHGNGGSEGSFSAKGVTMKAQGTSSLDYIASALNLDLDFSTATSWKNGLGNSITEYSFNDDAIGVDYFNLKADVASSEQANNVVNVGRYNRFNPFAFKGKTGGVRDTVEGHPCAVFFTNNGNSKVFLDGKSEADSKKVVLPGQTVLYFAGNMNNSKKNFKVFGQTGAYNTADAQQCCVEIMNNNNPEVRFKSVIDSNELWTDVPVGQETQYVNNFQFRYPENPTENMKNKVREVQAWVVSTDYLNPTGDDLETPIVYNDVTYSTDNADYRKAKFLNELDEHFHVDNLYFHYLYTEFTCGVDNRAKNTFMSYEPDEDDNWKWSFRTHYDHDTAYGTDNSGFLTFPYGLEDIDKVDGKWAYNAHDSVLWYNIRTLCNTELSEMYGRLESQKCWDADDILNEFNSYQSARPEALEIEDAFNKYRLSGEITYRAMMQGTKEYQRDYFIPKQEVYMASKYAGSKCTNNKITIRINVNDGQVTDRYIRNVIPATSMYVRYKYGNVGQRVYRAKENESCDIPIPGAGDLTGDVGVDLNDLETNLFSSRDIASMGTLSNIYPKLVNMSNAPLLRRVEIGSNKTGYKNEALRNVSFGDNPYLEYIDIRNLPNVKIPLDLKKATSLEELYSSGSGFTSVEFAKGAPLKKANLNNPSVLNAINLDDISAKSDFTIDSTNLTSIRIENSPNIDSLKIVKNAKNLAKGRLIGVNWEDTNADALLSLIGKKGLDENGNEIEKFVLRGKVTLLAATDDELEQIKAFFPEPSEENGYVGLTVVRDGTLDSYTVTFVDSYTDSDGTEHYTVLDTQTVRRGSDAIDPRTKPGFVTPVRDPDRTTVYTFKGWDRLFTNIRSDVTVNTVYNTSVRTYTVTWWNNSSHIGDYLYRTTVNAGGDAVYGGTTPSPEFGDIWAGWSSSTREVYSDLDVHSVYVTPVNPDTFAKVTDGYDYLYADDCEEEGNTEVSAYTFAEFCGIIIYNKAKEYFSVGDKIKIVNDTPVFPDKEFVLQVYGFNHYKNSGKEDFAQVVFGLVDTMIDNMPLSGKGIKDSNGKERWHDGNSGGWPATYLRYYLNDVIFPALPIKWQQLIKNVDVLSTAGNKDTSIVTSADKLFLLSIKEVGFDYTGLTLPEGEVDEGADNERFTCFTNSASRKKYNQPSAGAEKTVVGWWLRSPNVDSTSSWWHVGTSGIGDSGRNVNEYSKAYISFCFCL